MIVIKSRIILFCFLFLFSTAGHSSTTEDAEKNVKSAITVAILPFNVRGDGLEKMGDDLQALLTAQLSGNPEYLFVERAEVDKAFSELELGISGNVTPETAAQIGQIIGAQILITGRIFPVRNELALVAKMVATETSLVLGATTSMPINGSLVQASEELAYRLQDKLQKNAASMVAEKQTPEDLVKKLLPMVEGKKLPSISILIPETSLSRNVPDPAVETEIGLILQKLGFRLLSPAASNEVPDITITGEAFSEFGLRRGNLVSVKGRAEIKAINTKDGSVLLMDRETAVAVDIAPEIAGKLALQKSGQRLAERLVKKIIE